MIVIKQRKREQGSLQVLVTLVVIVFLAGCAAESDARYYRDYEEARQGGALEVGWLPSFLPPSAYHIWEKHNFDNNHAVVSFKLPKGEALTMLNAAKEVPEGRYREAAPYWVGREVDWLPQELYERRIADLVRAGFRVYEFGGANTNRIAGNKILKWFVAVDVDRGIVCAWS